jgi:hypothetical protein
MLQQLGLASDRAHRFSFEFSLSKQLFGAPSVSDWTRRLFCQAMCCWRTVPGSHRGCESQISYCLHRPCVRSKVEKQRDVVTSNNERRYSALIHTRCSGARFWTIYSPWRGRTDGSPVGVDGPTTGPDESRAFSNLECCERLVGGPLRVSGSAVSQRPNLL